MVECARIGLPAFGFDINPSAWSFSKVYEFANLLPSFREQTIEELQDRIVEEFPIVIFTDPELDFEAIEERIVRIGTTISDEAKILCSALVVLLDLHNNKITADYIRTRFSSLANLVRSLPVSTGQIKVHLQDARSLSLESQSIDFVITSPPYMNVFNYHQNYRRSVELLGWDVLRVARSELGSNRANRSNRFLTVVQYCIDMAATVWELARVLRPGGSAVMIAGHESKVLGVPFYNADIIHRIATESGMFESVLRQQREFKNRFGLLIREDILSFSLKQYSSESESSIALGQRVAYAALEACASVVPKKNVSLLNNALANTRKVEGTPLFIGGSFDKYQTRDSVMVVKEKGSTTTDE